MAAGSVSLVSLAVFLESDSARVWMQEKVNAAIPGTIEWRRHIFSLFSGGVTVENVSLRDKAGEPVVSLAELELKILWSDILRGNLTFEFIRIDRLTVQLRIDPAGRLNLLESLQEGEGAATQAVPQGQEDGTGFPFNVIIRKAGLRNGNLQYYENTVHRLNLPKIDLEFENGDLQKEEITVSGKLLQPEIHFEEVQAQFAMLRLQGVYAQDQIPLFSITGDTVSGSRIHASGKIRDLYEKIKPEGTVELDGELTDILKTFSVEEGLGGRFAGKAALQGDLSNPSISLAATCRNADIYGTKLDQVGITMHWENGVVTVDEFILNSWDSVLQANGTVDLQDVLPRGFLSDTADMDQVRYQLTGTLDADRTGRTSESADGIAVSAHSKFAVTGKGVTASARAGKATLEAKIRELKGADALLVSDMSVSAAVDYEKQAVNIARFDIQAGEENHFSGSGTVDLDSGTITGKVSAKADLRSDRISVPAVTELEGRLQLFGSITGTVDTPEISGSFQAGALSYRDIHIEAVATNYQFSHGRLDFQEMQIRNANSVLDLSGTLLLPNPENAESNPIIDAAIHGDPLLLQDFLPQLEGKVAINGVVSGDITRPAGNLRITGENFGIYGQTIETVNLSLHADDAKITVEEARIVVREEEAIQVAGWVSPYQGEYKLRVFSEGISLGSVNSISGMNWGPSKVDFAVAGQGHFDHPTLSGKIGATSLFARVDHSDRFEAKIDFAEGKLQIMESGGKDIAAKIDFKTGEIEANANLNQVPLSPWFRLAGQDQLSGSMDMALELKGQYPEWERTSAKAVLSDAKVLWNKKDLLQADRFHVTFQDGKIDIPPNRVSFPENGFLDVTGTAMVSGAVNISLSGRLPAKILEMAAADEISDMDGTCLVSAAIEGTWEKPAFRSSIIAQNMRGKIPYLSEAIREVTGEIQITPDRIEVNELYGRSGAGWIVLNGPIDISAYPDLTADLTLRSHALPVAVSGLSILLTSSLSLHLAQDIRRLSGELVVLEGEYTQDVNINPIMAVAERTRKVGLLEKRTDDDLLESIELDIAIKSRNAFVVDNNISLLQLKPDLHIQGSAARPVFTGRAEVTSGTISYQRKEFAVTKGVVDFINPYKIEPHIDVEGETQVRRWKIYLTVEGVPENLKIRLRSEPDLPDGDILTLLVFGKTARELIEGEGGKSTSPGELAAALMSDRLQKGVKDAVGLDSVEVGYSSNGTETDSSQMKIEVGKDFSRYVTVKYGVETSKSKIVQRAITEYRFLENLILEAYQNTEGDYGGELKYRLEFR